LWVSAFCLPTPAVRCFASRPFFWRRGVAKGRSEHWGHLILKQCLLYLTRSIQVASICYSFSQTIHGHRHRTKKWQYVVTFVSHLPGRVSFLPIFHFHDFSISDPGLWCGQRLFSSAGWVTFVMRCATGCGDWNIFTRGWRTINNCLNLVVSFHRFWFCESKKSILMASHQMTMIVFFPEEKGMPLFFALGGLWRTQRLVGSSIQTFRRFGSGTNSPSGSCIRGV